MNRQKGSSRGGRDRKPGSQERPAQGPLERAESLMLRLETDGANPVTAAEELDRLQGRLEKDGNLGSIRLRVSDLCDAWSDPSLRGDRARAWLVLVGAFDLKEHVARAAELAQNGGLPGAQRVPAIHVLARLGGEEAVQALQAVLLSRTDAPVRVAAAEALGQLGDRSVRPVLEALLEEEIPSALWSAVSAARDRLW